VLNLSTGGRHATGRLEFVSSTCHQNSNLMVRSLIKDWNPNSSHLNFVLFWFEGLNLHHTFCINLLVDQQMGGGYPWPWRFLGLYLVISWILYNPLLWIVPRDWTMKLASVGGFCLICFCVIPHGTQQRPLYIINQYWVGIRKNVRTGQGFNPVLSLKLSGYHIEWCPLWNPTAGFYVMWQ
jgi:hypothetical protein